VKVATLRAMHGPAVAQPPVAVTFTKSNRDCNTDTHWVTVAFCKCNRDTPSGSRLLLHIQPCPLLYLPGTTATSAMVTVSFSKNNRDLYHGHGCAPTGQPRPLQWSRLLFQKQPCPPQIVCTAVKLQLSQPRRKNSETSPKLGRATSHYYQIRI